MGLALDTTLETKVEVVTSGRLHLGLLDLSGVGPRVDGGIGLAIEEPSLRVVANHSSEQRLSCPPELETCCVRAVHKLTGSRLTERAAISVYSSMRSHVGFGSGTQCSLAIGCALSTLKHGTTPSIEDIARLTGRGGTSGIGINVFDRGGFVVDGGHRWPEDKQELGPTGAFDEVAIAPLVARLVFPDWGILIAVPLGRRATSGQAEVALFKSLVPMPIREVEAACRTVLLGILPAIASSDFKAFGSAMEQYRQLGMKKRQIDLASSTFTSIREDMENFGARGVTVSCWGPAVVGFFRSVSEAEIAKEKMTNRSPDLQIICTLARNQGADIRTLKSDQAYHAAT